MGIRERWVFWLFGLAMAFLWLTATVAQAVDIQHKKNTAFQLAIPMVDSATPADYLTGLSPTDTAFYCDADSCANGAWPSLAITDTFSEISTIGVYHLGLSASELNHDQVFIVVTASGAATTLVMFTMYTNDIDTTLTVNLAADAITASVYDESTAYPLKSADTGSTEVARTGADSDTLKTLSDEIGALNDPTAIAIADAVWDETDDHVANDTYGKHVNTLIEWTAAIRDDVVNLDGFDPTTDGMVLGDVAHGGSAATLTLASVVVTNPSGTAVALTSSGGGGDGLNCHGDGNGHGIESLGGLVAYGIKAAGGSFAGHGIYAEGVGFNAGMKAQGGPNGSGFEASAGVNAGDAIECSQGNPALLDADVVQEIVDAMFQESVDGKTFDSMMTALTAVVLGKTAMTGQPSEVAFKKIGSNDTKVTLTYDTGTRTRTGVVWDDD